MPDGVFEVGSTEAESLDLTGAYEVETRAGASGGEVIRIDPAATSGTATGTFNGATGNYRLSIDYINEDDGVSNWQVLVNGVVIGTFSGTGGTSAGQTDTANFNTELDNGDTIAIVGVKGDGELARLDKIDIIETGTLDVGSFEAEDLILGGTYEIEARSGVSGGAVVRAPEGTGTVSGEFTGASGAYEIDVTYLDENDGAAFFELLVNGVVIESWLGDGTGSGPGVPTVEIVAVALDTGDTVTIRGTRGGGEQARVDKIDISPGATINVGVSQAEDLTLDNYEVEANGGAQGGEVIRTEGTGTASGIFTGISGTYDFTVNYLDENDGESTYIIFVNGVQQSTFVADGGNSTGGTPASETVRIDVNAGDTISVQGTREDAEFARIDSVELIVVDTAPVAGNDAATTPEDTPVVVNVLANDSDGENDPLNVTAIAGTGVFPGESVDVGDATVTLNANNTFTVTPDNDFSGDVTFTYTVSDGARTTDASVSVTVTAVNDAPIAADDTASTTEDVPVNVNVLANDVDPEGAALSVSAIEGTAVTAGNSVDVGNATVRLEANGTLTITPDANFDGTVDFEYTASDGGETDTASVSLSISGQNDGLTGVDDIATTAEDTAVVVDVLGNDIDPDGDDLTVTAIDGTPVTAGDSVDVGNATVRLNANGRLTVTPDADFSGQVTFAYTVFDGALSDTASVTVAVTGVNDGPDAKNDNVTTQEDVPVAVNVTANDTDPEGDALVVTAIAGTPVVAGGSVDVGNATVTLQPNGNLSIEPDADFSGSLSFAYTVSDGSLTDTATANVTVEGVIDPPTDGDDTIEGTNEDDNFSGGEGNDTLLGFAGDDTLFGNNGNDILAGGGGDDLLIGDSGNDDLRGGSGVDTLLGGEGNDLLRVGSDNDLGFGGNGEDFLQGAAGDDTLFGEDGDDLIYGGTGNDTLDGGNGDDELLAGRGTDEVRGGNGDDIVLGQNDDDTVSGGTGNDLVNGGGGNDRLFGGAGNDTLNGGAGDDTIDGGAGNDMLFGQGGVDTFVFDGDDGGSDIVTGYTAGETIMLEDFGYASAEQAAADFRQEGNDVVFENGDTSVTFTGTTLFTVFDGIEVSGSGAQSSQTVMAPVSVAPEDDDAVSFDGFDFDEFTEIA